MGVYIQAIPTRYNGIDYRSRLEAEFARWLTERSIRFQYEPVVHVRYGFTYRPDFRLIDYGVYVEIKPRRLVEELDTHRDTIREAGIVLLIVDSPRRGAFEAYANIGAILPGEFSWGPGGLRCPSRGGTLQAGRMTLGGWRGITYGALPSSPLGRCRPRMSRRFRNAVALTVLAASGWLLWPILEPYLPVAVLWVAALSESHFPWWVALAVMTLLLLVVWRRHR